MRYPLHIQFFGGRGASGNTKTTKSQLDALERYVSGETMYLNQYLRGDLDIKLSSDEKKMLNDLDKLTQSDKTNGKTLYRSVDATSIFGNISDTDYENLYNELKYQEFSNGKGDYSQNIAKKLKNLVKGVEGKIKIEKGLMSTTKDSSIAENFGDFTGSDKPIVLEIKTQNNTKGYDVMKNASNKMKQVERDNPQKEVLLARGQSYTINKVGVKNGNIYVKVTMK